MEDGAASLGKRRIDSSEAQLVREATFSPSEGTQSSLFPLAPFQFEDGRLAYALLNFSNADDETRGLYTFAIGNSAPHKINGLPPASEDYGMSIAWSPDGSGAVVQDYNSGLILYAPADGSALYDLRPVLGDYVCCFTWLK